MDPSVWPQEPLGPPRATRGILGECLGRPLEGEPQNCHPRPDTHARGPGGRRRPQVASHAEIPSAGLVVGGVFLLVIFWMQDVG